MNESALDIAVLINDPAMIRIVATWPRLSEKQRDDEQFIADAAGVIKDQIKTLLLRARVHNLIHEDGTINTYAEKFISGLVAERLLQMNKNRNGGKA